jgi:hypothetical protein
MREKLAMLRFHRLEPHLILSEWDLQNGEDVPGSGQIATALDIH